MSGEFAFEERKKIYTGAPFIKKRAPMANQMNVMQLLTTEKPSDVDRSCSSDDEDRALREGDHNAAAADNCKYVLPTVEEDVVADQEKGEDDLIKGSHEAAVNDLIDRMNITAGSVGFRDSRGLNNSRGMQMRDSRGMRNSRSLSTGRSWRSGRSSGKNSGSEKVLDVTMNASTTSFTFDFDKEKVEREEVLSTSEKEVFNVSWYKG